MLATIWAHLSHLVSFMVLVKRAWPEPNIAEGGELGNDSNRAAAAQSRPSERMGGAHGGRGVQHKMGSWRQPEGRRTVDAVDRPDPEHIVELLLVQLDAERGCTRCETDQQEVELPYSQLFTSAPGTGLAAMRRTAPGAARWGGAHISIEMSGSCLIISAASRPFSTNSRMVV